MQRTSVVLLRPGHLFVSFREISPEEMRLFPAQRIEKLSRKRLRNFFFEAVVTYVRGDRPDKRPAAYFALRVAGTSILPQAILESDGRAARATPCGGEILGHKRDSRGKACIGQTLACLRERWNVMFAFSGFWTPARTNRSRHSGNKYILSRYFVKRKLSLYFRSSGARHPRRRRRIGTTGRKAGFRDSVRRASPLPNQAEGWLPLVAVQNLAEAQSRPGRGDVRRIAEGH